MIGVSRWQVILGLIVGGLIAAPFARLVGKLPMKTMLMAVGIMVVIWSTHTAESWEYFIIFLLDDSRTTSLSQLLCAPNQQVC